MCIRDRLNSDPSTITKPDIRFLFTKCEACLLYTSTLEGEEQAKYTYLKALCQPLMIYLDMWDTDMYGSMAYTEACLLYTSRCV